jgi:hypothetical protein
VTPHMVVRSALTYAHDVHLLARHAVLNASVMLPLAVLTPRGCLVVVQASAVSAHQEARHKLEAAQRVLDGKKEAKARLVQERKALNARLQVRATGQEVGSGGGVGCGGGSGG